MRSSVFQQPAAYTRPVHLPLVEHGEAWSRVIARAVAGLVAGSGILNLSSLLGGFHNHPQPEWLRGFFPLDFVGASRSLTLLSGFALILGAIHLWTQRHRAWQLSLALTSASAIFHLTKGWDVEEAVCSLIIAGLLWFTRRQFSMGAGPPQFTTAALRALASVLVAAVYGAAGFWLLDPAEFHQNFHWWDAMARTLGLMFFPGDRTLVPHTPHAAWFLDSLLWITAAAFLYSGLALFRPVAYRFTQDSSESALAAQIAAEYGNTAQDYFKHYPDKSYFFSSTRESFLGYRVAGNYALVLGDPVGPPTDLGRTVTEFVAHCRRRGWRVGFHQVAANCLHVYEALGFRKLRIGDDAIADLTKFSLSGSAMKEFRNTVARLDRLGYRVERIDPPLSEPLLSDLKRISDRWLEIPNHRERQFTLGRFEHWYVQSTPVYVVFDVNDHAAAFLNLVPSYEPGLATADLMRRSHHSVNGLMDYLFAKVFLDLKQRGVVRFSLGMAPLADLSGPNPVSTDEQVVHWVMKRMRFLFRADSLRRFKAKYATYWTPRYAVYQNRLDLPRLALALRRVSEHPSRSSS